MEWIKNSLWKILVMGIIIPAMLLIFMVSGRTSQVQAESTSGSTSMPTTDSRPVVTRPDTDHLEIYISVMTDTGVVQMAVEEYVVGVVLAEVPASFEMEALKAQAVASRTYALCACEAGRHGKGDICTRYTCCQAYISPEIYLAYGGSEKNLEKIRTAVEETKGQVLTYQGMLICATYFSCSGGRTEDAAAVWGTEIPYLQAVESPGEEFAEVYSDCFCFTPEAFQTALGVQLDGEVEEWFGEIRYTDGGGVDSLCIGGVEYRGTTLRALLGLRSTVFLVHVDSGMIFIDTLGYGHRVGMSQYGAQAMALSGSQYAEILAHYYQNTRLEKYPLK